MGNIELQATHALAFMAAGGICLAFALYLLVRPPHHGTTKIEMFGMKFEASSAAILVFLAGLALLLTPVWSDEAPAAPDTSPRGSVASAPEPAARVASQSQNFAVSLPPDPDVPEAEPNDRVQEANQLAIGQTAAGSVIRDDQDWFVVPFDLPDDTRLAVNLRHIETERGSMHVAVLDSNEIRLGQFSIDRDGVRRFEEFASGDRIYIRIMKSSVTDYVGRYELFVTVLEDDG